MQRVAAIIHQLTQDYAFSMQANHRKGGLLALAASAVALAEQTGVRLVIVGVRDHAVFVCMMPCNFIDITK